ncbi:amidase family protein [Rhizodiscina lignyota]|uniref:Amidase family protein n=1 Tax=Rhizodiscina lignyota TaxID=1504668 RepID=A0A9P4I6K3_9PEZI|nr:amidase family protein [Rhizodiscina lignyota]
MDSQVLYKFQVLVLCFAYFLLSASAAVVQRSSYVPVTSTPNGDEIFQIGNISYLAALKQPKAKLKAAFSGSSGTGLATVISTSGKTVTADSLKATLAEYISTDDVLTEDFLSSVYLTSSTSGAYLDSSAVQYLSSMSVEHVMLHSSFSNAAKGGSFKTSFVPAATSIAPGPYATSIQDGTISFSPVYRLYSDTYRDFLFGAYDSGDGKGTHIPLGAFLPHFWDPMIPVPSRLYSIGDTRPLAGVRVAIKDLYDIKGLQTSGGSQAWAYITPIANATAPSIQRIYDLGGVLVGKYKLAQFASGANPWDWQDEHYPFNPRGDGYLTCSASSSGGGCSVAGYDWLDNAIGSDTGSSMRRPAAVSGTYGQRPSQGMISLDRVLPLGAATDTAGVFSRDPKKWVKFAKAWYSPDLHQPPSITGLSPLVVPDTDKFPKTILYPTDYLPLNNSAAQPILEAFISNLTTVFGMTVKKFNFSETVANSGDPIASNFSLTSSVTGVIDSWTQYDEVGKPLVDKWAELFDGRYPPLDPAHRDWKHFNTTINNPTTYAQALKTKKAAVDWYEKHLQFSTPESCSESVMLYDIGTGGLPSYRELDLNGPPSTSFLAVKPAHAAITGASICPIFACADFTIPIGQTTYFSNVTFHEEIIPVTINMVVKRGCDFMLFNMIEKLADAGVLKTVKTGKAAF